MSEENKILAEKLQMFFNLIYHIDDYIKNKKERKGQLSLSKNIRLILREVISSVVNLNILLNNEYIESNVIEKKKSLEEIKKDNAYIKMINPLSFNQKNMNNINLFYNSNNEIFVLNYLILDKIFAICRYCLYEIIKKKNSYLGLILENNKDKFVLNNIAFSDFANDDETNEQNIIRKMLKKKYYIEKSMNEKRKLKIERLKINNLKKSKFIPTSTKSRTIDVAQVINNNYLIKNAANNLIKEYENDKANSNYLKKQIYRINRLSVPLIKKNNAKTNRVLKNSMSLPLIYDKQISHYKLNSYYSREKDKIKNKKKNGIEYKNYFKLKKIDTKIFSTINQPINNKFKIKSRNIIMRK